MSWLVIRSFRRFSVPEKVIGRSYRHFRFPDIFSEMSYLCGERLNIKARITLFWVIGLIDIFIGIYYF